MGIRTLCVVGSLSLFALACGDDGGGGSGGSLDGDARGSAACQEWQDAVCQKAKDCGADQALCLENYRSFECVSDTKAKQCTLAWQKQTACESAPDCDFVDVADPVPAQERCQEFTEVICAASARCEGTVEADCLANAGTELPCEFAIGSSLDFEECLAILKGECVTDLPKSCEGAVLLNQ